MLLLSPRKRHQNFAQARFNFQIFCSLIETPKIINDLAPIFIDCIAEIFKVFLVLAFAMFQTKMLYMFLSKVSALKDS